MLTICGLDLETTGLLAAEHRIIEAAAVFYEWDGTTATKVKEYVQRIDPKRSIDAKARAVHGITENDLIGKPTWDVVGPALAIELDKADLVVGHNLIGFDAEFLIMEWERIKCPLPEFEVLDTMEEGRFATPLGAAPNLGALCWACGVDYDPEKAHSALYDVEVMMECLWYGLRRGVFALPNLTAAAA
jgi:DNA polymerase-3 subunit epsilon